MKSIIRKTYKTYLDFKSIKTNRKIIVIESDDWGSYRTMNTKVKNKINLISNRIKADRYIQLDNIANAEDLSEIFETLNSVKDKYGNPACITANVCTANPDFNKIKANNFDQYYYKPFTDALSRFSERESILDLWEEGIKQQVFMPQLHGREHLHALAWLAELKVGNKDLLKAFDLETWGIPYKALLQQRRRNLQAALDIYQLDGESQYHHDWILEGAKIFEKTFGFKSNSFIAPAYIWHKNHTSCIKKAGVKTMQGIKIQHQPKHVSKKSYKRILHFLGEIEQNTGLLHFPRNVFFEPALMPEKDWMSMTLNGIDEALKKHQPVIISSHRFNYIGSLTKENRQNNLKMLKKILQKVINQYPEVEFLSSNQLADLKL